jgi:hypothetical protein
MIDHHTIKFGPAVSQKELEKALHDHSGGIPKLPDLTKMKAKIEVVADFEDLKALAEFLDARTIKNAHQPNG